MFEYCSGRHEDPAYRFSGTIDAGIRDIDRGILLMYSIVNMGGQWAQLQVLPPMQFDYFNSINKIKGKTLKEIFSQAPREKGMKVTYKCVNAEGEKLLKTVRKDAASLTPADLASLETVISEAFA